MSKVEGMFWLQFVLAFQFVIADDAMEYCIIVHLMSRNVAFPVQYREAWM